MTRAEILAAAGQAVLTDRAGAYGSPEDNFAVVAGLWREAFGWSVTGSQVGLALALLKVARITTGRGYHADNYVDLAGYAACAAECAAREQRKEDPSCP